MKRLRLLICLVALPATAANAYPWPLEVPIIYAGTHAVALATVPNVVGLLLEGAGQKLLQAQLNIGVIESSLSQTCAQVTSQSIASGTNVPAVPPSISPQFACVTRGRVERPAGRLDDRERLDRQTIGTALPHCSPTAIDAARQSHHIFGDAKPALAERLG